MQDRNFSRGLSWCLSAFVSLCLFVTSASAQNIWDGIYTAEQARRGKADYDQSCSRCHNVAFIGSERGPAIKGNAFLATWEKDTVAGLFMKIRDTMPEGNSGTVSDDSKIDILAYILQQNGFPEGKAELKKDLAVLGDFRMTKKGIWDGVFTTAQADRGKAALLQNGCNGCHGAELAGERGPSLKGDRFLAAWENGSVNRLFGKIRDTMPPLNAEQVPPNVKLDIVAYLLQVNGFPAGAAELTADAGSLDGLQIIRKGADATRAPNFALVQVLGCLTQDANGRWMLTDTTEPAVAKEETPNPAALKAAEAAALGTGKFDLVSVSPAFKAESRKGYKMEARGLLYREANRSELNLISLEAVAPRCGSLQ
jgi:mono/diheme cytochrome c family protein